MIHAFDTGLQYQDWVSKLYDEWRNRADATEDFDEWKVAEIARLRGIIAKIAAEPLGSHEAVKLARDSAPAPQPKIGVSEIAGANTDGSQRTSITTDAESLVTPCPAPQPSEPEPRFRKIATIIAKQWFKAGDHPAVLTPPRMCVKGSDMRCEHCGSASGKHGEIVTLESGDGYQLVCPGDWIIRGVKGEFYPCKPDVFAQTYEPAQPSEKPQAESHEITKQDILRDLRAEESLALCRYNAGGGLEALNAALDCRIAIKKWREGRSVLDPPESHEKLVSAAKERPKIVCLCGSTRFYQKFVEANYLETMAGHIVLSVGFYPHAAEQMHGEGVGITPEQKEALDELHKRKIDLADEVYVLNVGGYIGSSTRSEIDYAVANGKSIRYLESAIAEEGK